MMLIVVLPGIYKDLSYIIVYLWAELGHNYLRNVYNVDGVKHQLFKLCNQMIFKGSLVTTALLKLEQ